MKIKGLSVDELQDCAKVIGVELDNIRTKGNFVLFKVRLIDETYRKYRHKRKVAAVCWHGFRDFIKEVYKINSTAKIVTMLTCYEDKQNFEATYSNTGYINIGSECMPLLCQDACHCHQEYPDV